MIKWILVSILKLGAIVYGGQIPKQNMFLSATYVFLRNSAPRVTNLDFIFFQVKNSHVCH
jgi:hypothetical protein